MAHNVLRTARTQDCDPHYDPVFKVVRVPVGGLLGDAQVQQCMLRTASLLQHTDCKAILVDFAGADLVLTEQASPARMAEFAERIAKNRRVAMLYKTVGQRQKSFRERTAALGLTVGVFAEEVQALHWLLQSTLAE
jgi:hypothetical protein